MIYFVCALEAEARSIIEFYNLSRDYSLPYKLYVGTEAILLISGIGSENTLTSLSAILGYKKPKKGDLLVNLGICGAPSKYPIGTPILVHKIYYNNRIFYPDILFVHPFIETELTTLNQPQSIQYSTPVDMEAGAIFVAASKFFNLHEMIFIKIVSDHFDPSSITKEKTIDLLGQQFNNINSVVTSVKKLFYTKPLFTNDELFLINQWKEIFTLTQQRQFEDALKFFRFKNGQIPLMLPLIPEKLSKHERNRIHADLVSSFTH